MGKRGKSQAVKDAMAHLAANPNATAQYLATRYGLNISTIYRSDWWKAAKEQSKCQVKRPTSLRPSSLR